MERSQSGRRDLIKNIAIVFLIVLLLLTFFSTTIMNRSLPEVATQSAYGGQIVSSVRVSGMTEANENYQVIIEEGRVIRSVNVRRGQTVEEGEILFLLEDAESAELQSALDALNDAKTNYARWQIQTKNAVEDMEQEIAYAKEDLQKVRGKGVAVSVNTEELEAEIRRLTKELAVYSLSSAQQAFDEAEAAYEAAKKEYADARSAYEETLPALAEAQAAYDTAKAGVDNAQTVVDAIEQEISVAEHALDGEQREMNTAQENVTAVQKTYDDAKQAVLDAEQKKTDAQTALDTAENAVTAAKEQLEQAKETLAEAEADRVTAENDLKTKKNSSPSYTSDFSALTSAARHVEDMKIALKRMQEEYDKNLADRNHAYNETVVMQGQVSDAYAAYEGAEEGEREALLAAYNTLKTEYDKKTAAVAVMDASLKTEKQALEDQTLAVRRAEEDYADLSWSLTQSDSQAWEDYRNNVIAPAEKAVEDAKKREADAQKNVTQCETAVQTAETDRDAAAAALAECEKALTGTETKLAEAELQLNEVKAVLDGESDDVGSTDDKIYEMRDRLFNAKIVLQNAQKSLAALEEPALNAAKAAQTEAEQKTDEALAAMNTAESEYLTAKENLSLAKESAKSNGKNYTEEELEALIQDTKYQLSEKKEELAQLQQSVSGSGYPDEESYREAVKAAERQVETLKTTLERTKETNALDEPAYTDAIERAQKEVDRLTSSVGSPVITAKVGGTVNNITVSAGQKVEAQTVLAEIEQQDRGYTVSLSLTAEQAKRVAVGQTATVLYYWGQTPTAVVESVKPDRNDPQNTRIVTLSVTGDITAGQSFTFSLGEKSANYDVIVPNSAVREDSSGSFVYVVKAKSTPVGNRYTAQRMDIEVIASDESNSAISGLMGGEFIITNSESPIAAGQQVRLADNG